MLVAAVAGAVAAGAPGEQASGGVTDELRAVASGSTGRPGSLPRPGPGYAAAVGAYVLWGLSPAFWPLLAPADAVESVAHRVAWTFLGMLLVITVAGAGWTCAGCPGGPGR